MSMIIVVVFFHAMNLQVADDIEDRALLMLRNMGVHSSFRRVDDDSQLARIYNEVIDEVASNADAVPNGKPPDYRDDERKLSEPMYLPETKEFIIKTFNAAVMEKDWETIRRCLVIAPLRARNIHMAEKIKPLVLFSSESNVNISMEQLNVALQGLVTIARMNLPGTADFIRDCCIGAAWKDRALECSIRSDFITLLQVHAIQSLWFLSSDISEPIITELEDLYPRELMQNGSGNTGFSSENARLALALFLVQEDIKQKETEGKSLIWGIRR